MSLPVVNICKLCNDNKIRTLQVQKCLNLILQCYQTHIDSIWKQLSLIELVIEY